MKTLKKLFKNIKRKFSGKVKTSEVPPESILNTRETLILTSQCLINGMLDLSYMLTIPISFTENEWENLLFVISCKLQGAEHQRCFEDAYYDETLTKLCNENLTSITAVVKDEDIHAINKYIMHNNLILERSLGSSAFKIIGENLGDLWI